MATILLIETATQVCSVALSASGKVVDVLESREKNSHSVTLTIFIKNILEKAGMAFSALDAIAVSKGPGSYTGLRIGVSTAKGLCFGLDRPLIAIGTLEAMAAGGTRSLGTPSLGMASHSLLCPMIDARRMEVYNALYDSYLNLVREIKAEIIQEGSFAEELKDHQVLFFGDGAEKCKQLLAPHPNARFLDDFQLSSTYMARLAEEKFNLSAFEDTVYFEPYYLKDFIPGISRVKGLQ